LFKKGKCLEGHNLKWYPNELQCCRCNEKNYGFYCKQCKGFYLCVGCSSYEFNYDVCPNKHKLVPGNNECNKCLNIGDGLECKECKYFICNNKGCKNRILNKNKDYSLNDHNDNKDNNDHNDNNEHNDNNDHSKARTERSTSVLLEDIIKYKKERNKSSLYKVNTAYSTGNDLNNIDCINEKEELNLPEDDYQNKNAINEYYNVNIDKEFDDFFKKKCMENKVIPDYNNKENYEKVEVSFIQEVSVDPGFNQDLTSSRHEIISIKDEINNENENANINEDSPLTPKEGINNNTNNTNNNKIIISKPIENLIDNSLVQNMLTDPANYLDNQNNITVLSRYEEPDLSLSEGGSHLIRKTDERLRTTPLNTNTDFDLKDLKAQTIQKDNEDKKQNDNDAVNLSVSIKQHLIDKNHFTSPRLTISTRRSPRRTMLSPNNKIFIKDQNISNIDKDDNREKGEMKSFIEGMTIDKIDKTDGNNKDNNNNKLSDTLSILSLLNTKPKKGTALTYDPNYPNHQRHIENLYNKGLDFYNQKNYTEAEKYYKNILTLQPEFKYAHNSLGLTLKKLNKLQEAESSFLQAIKLDPEYKEAYINLGVLLKNEKKYAEAERCYKNIIRSDSSFKVAHFNLGNTYDEQGKTDDAIRCYEQAIVHDPKYKRAYFNLAVALSKVKKFTEAVRCYLSVIELDKNFTDAYNNIGIIYYNQRKYKKAIVNYKRAIAINPKFKEAYNNLGNCLLNQGKLEEASENFKQAVRIDPNYKHAENNLFQVNLKIQKKLKAVDEVVVEKNIVLI